MTITIHIDEARKVISIGTIEELATLTEALHDEAYKVRIGGVRNVQPQQPAKFPDERMDKGPQA